VGFNFLLFFLFVKKIINFWLFFGVFRIVILFFIIFIFLSIFFLSFFQHFKDIWVDYVLIKSTGNLKVHIIVQLHIIKKISIKILQIRIIILFFHFFQDSFISAICHKSFNSLLYPNRIKILIFSSKQLIKLQNSLFNRALLYLNTHNLNKIAYQIGIFSKILQSLKLPVFLCQN
jgi:hypothetical protein